MGRRLALALGLATLLGGCARKPPPPPQPAPPATCPAKSPPPAPAATGRVWTSGTTEIPVIMYHDVIAKPEIWFDLSTAAFKRQLQALTEAKASFVRLTDVVAHLRDGKPLPPRAIALTFDQGTRGLYTDAWPLLKAKGIPATFFVHTGYVGRPSKSKQHVTWDQLRELEKSGLIDVEPMTVNFPEHLEQLSATDLRQELTESKARVEREMGHPARFFAYPYGDGDERVADALAQQGYEAAWNELRASDASPSDRYFLPRYNPKRIPEIIERWQHPKPPAPALSGPFALGQPIERMTATWSVSVPAPVADGPTRLLLGSRNVPCYHLLLAGGTFRPLSEPRELAAEGRPLVVVGKQSVVVCPYRRWMSADSHVHGPSDPLATLVPDPIFAVIGSRWLVREGKVLGTLTNRVDLVGVTAAGAVLWGRPRPDLPVKDVQAYLAGLKDLVAL